MNKLEKLRDELAEKQAATPTIALDTVSNTYRIQREGDFKSGFDACLKHLQAQADGKWSDAFLFKELAILCANSPDLKLSANVLKSVNDLRDAYDQCKAQVEAMKAELAMENDYADDIREKLEDAKESIVAKDAEIERLKAILADHHCSVDRKCRLCDSLKKAEDM